MKRLLFQGDSITDCWRTPDVLDPRRYGYGYVQMLAGDLGCREPGRYECVNRGSGGDQLAHVYARWQRETIALKPDVITLLAGVNDLIRDGSAAVPRYRELLDILLKWTHEALPETVLVLLEPFSLPCAAGAQEWSKAMPVMAETVRNAAKKFNLVFIPLQAELNLRAAASQSEQWLWDGVHPTPGCNRLLADLWLAAAEKNRLL